MQCYIPLLLKRDCCVSVKRQSEVGYHFRKTTRDVYHLAAEGLIWRKKLNPAKQIREIPPWSTKDLSLEGPVERLFWSVWKYATVSFHSLLEILENIANMQTWKWGCSFYEIETNSSVFAFLFHWNCDFHTVSNRFCLEGFFCLRRPMHRVNLQIQLCIMFSRLRQVLGWIRGALWNFYSWEEDEKLIVLERQLA